MIRTMAAVVIAAGSWVGAEAVDPADPAPVPVPAEGNITIEQIDYWMPTICATIETEIRYGDQTTPGDVIVNFQAAYDDVWPTSDPVTRAYMFGVLTGCTYMAQ